MNEKNVKIISSGVVGPAKKRDIGFNHSSGEIIVFLDDDSYPAKNFFNLVKELFRKKKVSVVGGPGMTPLKSSISEKLSGIFFSSFLGGGFPERYYPIGKLRFVEEWPTVNFLMRRVTFKKVKGFGRDIWPGEDTYLCKKLKKIGEKIYYEPNLRVWHFRRTNIYLHLKQVSNYGSLRGKLCREKLSLLKDIKYYIPSLWLIGLFLTIYFSIIYNFKIIGIFLATYFSLIFISFYIENLKENFIIRLLSLTYFFLSHFLYGLNFIKSFVFK